MSGFFLMSLVWIGILCQFWMMERDIWPFDE